MLEVRLSVNEPLETISLELGFSGNTMAEGLVVRICLGGAFIGCLFSGWIADGIGRRRAFQFSALPMIIGVLLGLMSTHYEPPFFRSCSEQEANHSWSKSPLKMEVENVNSKHLVLAVKVKSVLDPCEDENNDMQDDGEVSLEGDSTHTGDSSDSAAKTDMAYILYSLLFCEPLFDPRSLCLIYSSRLLYRIFYCWFVRHSS